MIKEMSKRNCRSTDETTDETTDKDMHLQVRQAILKTANINQEILSSSASATSLARWVHISAENLTVLRC